LGYARGGATTNHATPHGHSAAYDYVPIPLELEEKPLVPFPPAGASWSNVRDLARYLITELRRGRAPDGTRVVSAENLQRTWEPQVEIVPGAHYGMGWITVDYKGQRLILHTGGTPGFTSQLTFLPDADLGLAILSNAQNANLFVGAVQAGILDLVLGQSSDSVYAARLEAEIKRFHEKAHREQPFDESAAESYAGSYYNSSLGEVTLAVNGGKLTFSVPDFVTEVRRLDSETYMFWDPPLAGSLLRFAKNNSAKSRFILDADDPDIPEKYAFERSK
jgi:CubicO group peptidase (beta-lactamase class C family)